MAKWGFSVYALLALSFFNHLVTSAHAAEIRVLAGGAMTAIWTEIKPKFEQASGHKLDIFFGTTPNLIKEATAGKPFDVGIVPVDTVKRIHKNKIRATLPREHLVLAQTPQVFRFDLLKKAFELAREDSFLGTDESSLVERLEQVEVSVVQGSDRNIKITKPTDMDLARLFLEEETAGKPA